MSALAEHLVRGIGVRLRAHRDPARAIAMKAYLRDQFAFFGVMKDVRTPLEREAIAEVLGRARPSETDLAAIARLCWARPQREFQYFALGLLRRHVPKVASASFLSVAHELILARSWWDTVDELAAHVVGPLVSTFPTLVVDMDRWAASKEMWLARASILHQLRYRERTDAGRLFRACSERAGEKDFFYRKAIGWALRTYAATDADAVASFVEAHRTKLSPLSIKEALRGVERARS